jgi:hypothetical protein
VQSPHTPTPVPRIPAEHTLDGNLSRMEVHLVHADPKNVGVVIGVMVEELTPALAAAGKTASPLLEFFYKQLPDAANDYMMMFDVEINPGNGGGPILDRTGVAIAIATAKYNSAFVGNYSCGIVASKAIPFAKTIIPGFEQFKSTEMAEKSWPDVDAAVSPSTAMIRCYYRTVSIKVGQGDKNSNAKVARSIWEDVSCSVCFGSGGVRCPNTKCVSGVVQTRVEYSVAVGEGALRTSVQRFNLVRSECTVCGGKGRVDCKSCVNGRDSSVGIR